MQRPPCRVSTARVNAAHTMYPLVISTHETTSDQGAPKRNAGTSPATAQLRDLGKVHMGNSRIWRARYARCCIFRRLPGNVGQTEEDEMLDRNRRSRTPDLKRINR